MKYRGWSTTGETALKYIEATRESGREVGSGGGGGWSWGQWLERGPAADISSISSNGMMAVCVADRRLGRLPAARYTQR